MAPQATIFVRESGTLGRYFSTPDGRTLYVTDGDTVANQSSCVGDCAIAWIPFSASDPLSLPADVAGELTTFEREDGIIQLAYNGMPLYTYNVDETAGDTLGDGVGGVWWLASPGDQLGVPATPVAPTAIDMGTPRASGPVTVSMREFYIQSAAVTFATDVEYTFNVTNLGTAEHQFVVEAGRLAGRADLDRCRRSRDRHDRPGRNRHPGGDLHRAWQLPARVACQYRLRAGHGAQYHGGLNPGSSDPIATRTRIPLDTGSTHRVVLHAFHKERSDGRRTSRPIVHQLQISRIRCAI